MSKLEEDLPSLEELIPLNQSLITPELAAIFKIRSTSADSGCWLPGSTQNTQSSGDPQTPKDDTASGFTENANSGEEPARTLKRPRLVWTPQLHKRFVDAVAQLGIKNAVPKTIMQLMNVEGLTRENVASHLQKYRLYLKRMQGASSCDSDHLFASSPVPSTHFLDITHGHMVHSGPSVGMDGRFLGSFQRHPANPPLQQSRIGSAEDGGYPVSSVSTHHFLTLFPSKDN
eukprot:TRINITY_DN22889_c0_g1_i1.p1 TRINITY_DN22889_c0_g1~~TRINITY_DN22889_c0_g1_i1.p1  ORF type:complete len:230 (+),score=28.75 TRINITY_DN22889_c0_g1_i1:332-1021(+)